jgi:hypothetical protein
VRHLIGTSGDREPSAQLTDRALRAEVSRKARCAGSTLNPDEWFPVSTEAETARREAAAAIAIFTACPVRGAWLELALSRSRGRRRPVSPVAWDGRVRRGSPGERPVDAARVARVVFGLAGLHGGGQDGHG